MALTPRFFDLLTAAALAEEGLAEAALAYVRDAAQESAAAPDRHPASGVPLGSELNAR